MSWSVGQQCQSYGGGACTAWSVGQQCQGRGGGACPGVLVTSVRAMEVVHVQPGAACIVASKTAKGEGDFFQPHLALFCWTHK